MTKMLCGYRVLDITQFVAGPTCSRLMAELGADVIKVELTPIGDHARRSGLRSRKKEYANCTQSTYFAQHNHSKRSLAINLKSNKGQALIKKLIERSDVLVENFAPGVIGRMGLSYDEVKKINPEIIMCSISFAGQEGPLANEPGFDYMAAAYAGITEMIGENDRSPSQVSMAVGDSATGISAAMAVAVALLHRERTGEGQFIDCSLLDTYLQMHEDYIPRVGLRGDAASPERSGSQHPNGGPTGIFECGDGSFLQMMIMPYQWPRLLQAIGMPELEKDTRFNSPQNRRKNKYELQGIIEQWMAKIGDRQDILTILKNQRVPVAPVLTLQEAINHPHAIQRGAIRQIKDPFIGNFPIPGQPPIFSKWSHNNELRAPLLGEHNEEILTTICGLDKSEIVALHENGIINTDPTFLESPSDPLK